MDAITRDQVRCIKTLVGKLGIPDADAVVLGYSGMRTTHVSELTMPEAKQMIGYLKKLDPDEGAAERMRKKIIAMAYKRAALPLSASREQKQAVVNWLNEWSKKYGYKHKALNSYTAKELPKLVSQFEAVMDKLVMEL